MSNILTTTDINDIDGFVNDPKVQILIISGVFNDHISDMGKYLSENQIKKLNDEINLALQKKQEKSIMHRIGCLADSNDKSLSAFGKINSRFRSLFTKVSSEFANKHQISDFSVEMKNGIFTKEDSNKFNVAPIIRGNVVFPSMHCSVGGEEIEAGSIILMKGSKSRAHTKVKSTELEKLDVSISSKKSNSINLVMSMS